MYYIFTEPLFSETPWCKTIVGGLVNELSKRRYGYTVNILPSAEGGFAFLVGSNAGWFDEIINACEAFSVHPIILGSQSDSRFDSRCSCISSNIMQSVKEILNYLKLIGLESPALFGVNRSSLTNQTQLECFRSYLSGGISDGDVYYNDGSVGDCGDSLMENIHKYDSIIGVNDFASVILMKKLSEHGRKIPVITYGASELAKKYYPEVLTVSMGYENYGKAAMRLCDMLKSSPETDFVKVGVKCVFDDRFNAFITKDKAEALISENLTTHSDTKFYSDSTIVEMMNIENMLLSCDETDYKILNLLMQNESYEDIAEKLFCALNTVKYRVKKMKENCNCSSKSEMLAIFGSYCEI
ncbi:MAG: AsnC family transcriptional regulator [Clostridia bacterium]|nr:AsnC family transcriptional regulator [Clostridia bacterium]